MTGPSFEMRLIEALLFASAEPLSLPALAERVTEGVDVRAILAAIAERYHGGGVELVQVAGGYAFRTAEDLGPALRAGRVPVRKLSRAQMEALAIIAYHEPVTRAEIEEIRGVALGKGILDALLEAGWIRPRGRRQVPGRPMQWATTPQFLDHFGLASRDDLPGIDDLKAAGLLERRPGVTLAMRGEEASEAAERDG
ncbi:MAG: SMC-Scp complex subunit ScpB [Alphaproteobacteria bacterium]|nr:MAG: SMC-Scp complex subunit ScpB [Alphaproteobacteria bacterium]